MRCAWKLYWQIGEFHVPNAHNTIKSASSRYLKQNAVVDENLCITSPSIIRHAFYTLRWRHNDHNCVSNHQPHGCLLNRLSRRRSKKTSKLRVTGLCAGNSPGPVNAPHKGPVTRKMFPFDDVIMKTERFIWNRMIKDNSHFPSDQWVHHPIINRSLSSYQNQPWGNTNRWVDTPVKRLTQGEVIHIERIKFVLVCVPLHYVP